MLKLIKFLPPVFIIAIIYIALVYVVPADLPWSEKIKDTIENILD